MRTGIDAVLARMREAECLGIGAVVCDCTAETDLLVAADASLKLSAAVWVGSAGLAASLAALVAPTKPAVPPVATRFGAVLIVVGSLAEASRLQAKVLVENGRVVHLVVPPETLLAGSQAPAWRGAGKSLIDALASGRDVLLEIELTKTPDLTRGASLAASLAGLVGEAATKIGALVARCSPPQSSG